MDWIGYYLVVCELIGATQGVATTGFCPSVVAGYSLLI